MKYLLSILTVLLATSAHAAASQTETELINDVSILAPISCELPSQSGQDDTVFTCVDQETGGQVIVNLRPYPSNPAVSYVAQVSIEFGHPLSLEKIEEFKKAIVETGLRHFQSDRAAGVDTRFTGQINERPGQFFSPVYSNPKWQTYSGVLNVKFSPTSIVITISYVG